MTDLKMVRLLLRFNADVNFAPNHTGLTALDIAKDQCCEEIEEIMDEIKKSLNISFLYTCEKYSISL